ncbi:TatD family hydrolase [Laceyella putida]|uniref:TatD family hydrolase n=1 Tax=Laceyella putida TaxID=110101 RepID=A0ABW2RIB1_9BACL
MVDRLKMQMERNPIMLFDAHIHLEKYTDDEIADMCADPALIGMIAVSMDFASSQRTLELKRRYPDKVYAACGFHPEQPPQAPDELIAWIETHQREIDAIGEIGLPYYLRRKRIAEGSEWEEAPYLELLDQWLQLASRLQKPVILHGVSEDVRTILAHLDRHPLSRVHFHWLKTDSATLRQLAEREIYVSFTPDLLYKEETRKIAATYPRHLIMLETDGPWPHEGPWRGQRTHPLMIERTLRELAKLRGEEASSLRQQIIDNTWRFIG